MPKEYDYSLTYLGRPPFFADVYAGKIEKLREAFADLAAKPAELKRIIAARVRTQCDHTLLFIACYGAANKETVELLVANGADIMVQDLKKRRPLNYAANSANPNILKYLLEQYKAIYKAHYVPELMYLPELMTDEDGRSLLHAVCSYGSSPTDKKRGAELKRSILLLLNLYDTPQDMAKALNTPDNFGLTPLQYAKHYGYEEIFELVRELEIEFDTLLMPAEDTLEIPVQHPGVQTDFFGRTKFQELVFDDAWGSLDSHFDFEGLATDPNYVNKQAGFRDAAKLAIQAASKEVVEFVLKRARTNPNAVDGQSATNLHYAALRGDPEILQVALDYQNNVNQVDIFGMTPLHVLATSKANPTDREKCLHILVRRGESLFAKNNNGDTPLDVALKLDNVAIARALMIGMELTRSRKNQTSTEKELRAFALAREKCRAAEAERKRQDELAVLEKLSEDSNSRSIFAAWQP